MAEAGWTTVRAVVLAGTVEDIRRAVVPPEADVLVLECVEPHAGLAALKGRVAVPVVVLADVSIADATSLITDGADDVLARQSSFDSVMRAAQHARARQRRSSPRAEMAVPAPSTPTVHGTAGPVDGSGAPHPRDSGPQDMPPQLQAVGRLAGGVAHDFNNLLQVISGNAESLIHELEPSDTRHGAAQAIVDAARRATSLTHQLMAFGRRQTLIATPIDLSALVNEALGHLRGRVGPGVSVSTELGTKLPQIQADRSQLLEVLSNLADNATEAMPDGGTLTIRTDAVEVGDVMRQARPWLKPGQYVRLSVSDTGAGIEAQALPHLFEPFFSTKPQWGGTGLGLSSVYGIIKQSGGFIWVESELGQGTCITVLLPVAATAAPSVGKGPRGRVVLVEDDEGVRDLLEGVLTHYGFAVTAYPSAEAALGHSEPFDLLLSDVLLPGLNGPELAREMKQRVPGLPVLLMSGDTGHVVDAKETDPRGFLQKPFSAQTLVARVEELLARPQKKPRRTEER